MSSEIFEGEMNYVTSTGDYNESNGFDQDPNAKANDGIMTHDDQTAGSALIVPVSTDPAGPEAAGANHGANKAHKLTDKSLFFCLVLENPFYLDASDTERALKKQKKARVAARAERDAVALSRIGRNDDADLGDETDDNATTMDETVVNRNTNGGGSVERTDSAAQKKSGKTQRMTFDGYTDPETGAVATFMTDDDLLDERKYKGPNKFMKVIEMIKRLESRGFDLLPKNMVVPVVTGAAAASVTKASPDYVEGVSAGPFNSPDDEADDDVLAYPENTFNGWKLNKNALILSPDEDEMYIKIHGNNRQMLAYAELYYLRLRTNTLSSGGGQMMTYSAERESELCLSMMRNARQFEKDLLEERAAAESNPEGVDNDAINEIEAKLAKVRDMVHKLRGKSKKKKEGGKKSRRNTEHDASNPNQQSTSNTTQEDMNGSGVLIDSHSEAEDSSDEIEVHTAAPFGSPNSSAGGVASSFGGSPIFTDISKVGGKDEARGGRGGRGGRGDGRNGGGRGGGGAHGGMLTEEDRADMKSIGDTVGKGFILDVPTKMRLVTTMIREPWEYGGCGLQVYEMRNRGILVKHFFPLHNKAYQKEYDLDYWGSVKALFPFTATPKNKGYNPLYQSSEKVMMYFGESIALYFLWLHEYTVFLPWIAIPGVILTILPWISDSISRAITHGVFAILCVVWGVVWLGKWSRRERIFAVKFQQDHYEINEGARDEFRPSGTVQTSTHDIYHLNFEVPATLKRNKKGFYEDHFYSDLHRMLLRWLISFPLTLLLACMMVAILTFLTWWRFHDVGNDLVSYASSIISVVTSVVFGFIFQYVVRFTNWLENARTYTEEEHVTVMKNFAFSFFSFYYSMFIIALYPTDATHVERLKELETQMIIVCVVKPAVQNVQELVLPFVMTQLRRRVDTYDGYCGALCSVLSRKPAMRELDASAADNADDLTDEQRTADANKADKAKEGMRLWSEAQREPYMSTADDYLEITLQYGYMCMFAATFPWAPLAAFIYNVIEIKVDANKLLRFCQRPIAKPAKDIGGWNVINKGLSGFSMITNAYLICIMSPAAKNADIPDTLEWKWVSFILLQYIFIVASVPIFSWASRSPAFEMRVQTKHNILQIEEARNITTRRGAMRHRREEERKKRELDANNDDGGNNNGGTNNSTAASPHHIDSVIVKEDGGDNDEDNSPFGEGMHRRGGEGRSPGGRYRHNQPPEGDSAGGRQADNIGSRNTYTV